MIMYVNLMTVSFPSQFYKIGSESGLFLTNGKWIYLPNFAYLFTSCDMLKRMGLPINGWAMKS